MARRKVTEQEFVTLAKDFAAAVPETERRLMARVLMRFRKGFDEYGPVRNKLRTWDWRKERLEELIDYVLYREFEELDRDERRTIPVNRGRRGWWDRMLDWWFG